MSSERKRPRQKASPIGSTVWSAKFTFYEERVWTAGFRSVPPAATEGTDYIDTYKVNFAPFSITPVGDPYHVIFAAGDTGFCSTGTHYVEPSGRLLVSSSYRWAKDDLSEGAGYVSRVDECPSS